MLLTGTHVRISLSIELVSAMPPRISSRPPAKESK
jgi:hypothetical protein